MGVELGSVNVLSELERIGWKYEATADDEVRCICPSHEDQTPSASINTEKRVWNCKACKAKGDFVTFLALATKTDRSTIIVDLSTRWDLESVKEINPETVEKFHAKIATAGPLLKALRQRGISEEMIRAARLGYHDGRITIPIYDQQGRIVNVRRYLPGAPSDKKMQNTRGFGKLRLYRVADVVANERVWVCGGEMKALLVGSMLPGVGACSATGGEGAWSDAWSPLFAGKRVWVCMDIDEAGTSAARRIADKLFLHAAEVRVIKLPLDIGKYPTGDVNDYVGSEGATADELVRLMAEAEVYQHTSLLSSDEELGVRETTVAAAASAHNVGWRLRFDGVVSASDTTPYLIANEVHVGCTRDQPGCASCAIASIKQHDGVTKTKVGQSSKGVLELVGSSRSSHDKLLQEALGIPGCAVADLRVVSHHRVTDVRLSPQMGGQSHVDIRQPAFVVGAEHDLNVPYVFEGRVYPSPRNQQAVLVIDTVEDTVDGLAKFDPTEEELAALDIFREDDDIDSKVEQIYSDLEDNVTKVYGRRDMHILVDLAWHSVMKFTLDGREVNGWLNVLVIGDSSQGKTETTSQLMKHYSLGERVECKNASVAGLLGGLQQLGTRWFISWGAIPLNDKRLVILEELKGASTEVISRLTDMRSSGIAEIPKIERRRANARTRIIAVSNARSDRSLASYAFGVDAIKELVGSLEDVRRFDVAVALKSGVVDVDQMSRRSGQAEHRVTSELCRRLIMWAWTLKSEDVVFTPDAVEALHVGSRELCDRYSEDIPIVDRGTARLKVARLSAALAARLYSEDKGKLIVKDSHVAWVLELMRRVYDDPAFGYDTYSQARKRQTQIVDEAGVIRFLTKNVKHPGDLVRGLLYRDDIVGADLENWCEVDREAASVILSFLVRRNCLRRGQRSMYMKSTDFILLLKKVENSFTKSKNIEQEEDLEL